ncbi:MAG: glycosyltransferase family 4 protein, partial [Planctomycetota bacterium]
VRAHLGAKPGDFLVGYCGLHGLAQGLEVVIGAAEKLRDRPNIQIVMIGDGPTKQKLVAMANEKGLSNLRFFEYQPKKEIPAILASCDASLIPLSTRLPGTMPSKVYEALAAGVPGLVAKGCEGEALVRQFNTGRAFEALDADELAEAIVQLAQDPQECHRIRANCTELAKRFDRDAIADRTEMVLTALAAGQPLPHVSW